MGEKKKEKGKEKKGRAESGQEGEKIKNEELRMKNDEDITVRV